jgi:dTDP-4-amino-4,6-dideoxygalactose transaminase
VTRTSTTTIPLVDLQSQRNRLGTSIDRAITRVLEHGQFIMGPEVHALEERLASYAGVRHAVTCASGTDALLLALMAYNVGRGDAVVVPSFTFPATPEVVALVGATPVFADVLPDTGTIDPDSAIEAVDVAHAAGLRPRAIIAVDLFGQPADYPAIERLCHRHELVLVADAAQSFGATSQSRRIGSIGDISCTSFFPAKPLGCYGDGGAVFTQDDTVAGLLRSLRLHGQGRSKYDIARAGINGRLDTIQAAILLAKLTIFDEELSSRQRIADRYEAALTDLVTTPGRRDDTMSAWALYTVQSDRRDALANALAAAGISSAVHYPRPLHHQPAYRGAPTVATLPVAERLARRVLSVPMHPYLDDPAQDRVITTLHDACMSRSDEVNE